MSDLITTSQDAYRNACIATFVTLVTSGKGLAHRVKDEARGQTAAEYMGVLLLVAAIITAVVASGVGGDIKKAIVDQINDIKGAGDACKKDPTKC
jgi:hypothetical protein